MKNTDDMVKIVRWYLKLFLTSLAGFLVSMIVRLWLEKNLLHIKQNSVKLHAMANTDANSKKA